MTAADQPSSERGSESVERIDPERSVCVLIGVPDYEHLPSLPSVRQNLSELKAALTDQNIWGIPEDRVVTVLGPNSAFDLVEPIRVAARRADDTLIVYYTGHGLLNEAETELWLTLPNSAEEQPDTCVRADDVKLAIRKHGAARRRVLILDCCFSGQVMTKLSADDHVAKGRAAAVRTLRGVAGSYVMTSAPRDRPAYAPDKSRCTLFTGALVDVMREGVPNGPDMLGLHVIFKAVRKRVTEDPNAPEPQDEDRNGVGELDFIRNLSVLSPLSPSPVPGGISRRRAGRWSLMAGAAGLFIGLSVAPGLGLWQRTFPTPAGGPCSPQAVLLDHSDELNKDQIHNEPVVDLSALALTSENPARVIALTDDDPVRIFPLRLGQAADLQPSIEDTAKTLRKANGTQLDDWFDGEALVLERGKRTVLVGSETGPTIRRFDLVNGQQVGDPFPVPEELRTSPSGGGSMGRTIESLAVSPDGRHLYAGWEGPLAQDGDARGENILRIQRYKGSPGGTYIADEQYAYRSGAGLYLAELVAISDGRLLALERQYAEGLGNAVRIVEISVDAAQDVTGEDSLYRLPADAFAQRQTVFDLADCPAGGPGAVKTTENRQVNPLLGNVEGMALGAAWTEGRYRGWRPLYLVTDDNGSSKQITRIYSLALRL